MGSEKEEGIKMINKIWKTNQDIINECNVVNVFYSNHPNKENDYIVTEYEDDEGNLIRLDKEPTQKMLAFAPFAGQGSTEYPICPFCSQKLICKNHYVGDILNRADLLCNAISDITNKELQPKFRSDSMLEFYEIILSGNLEYSINPNKTLFFILNDILKQVYGRCLDDIYNEITNVYNKCLDLDIEFTYVFKNKDSHTISKVTK